MILLRNPKNLIKIRAATLEEKSSILLLMAVVKGWAPCSGVSTLSKILLRSWWSFAIFRQESAVPRPVTRFEAVSAKVTEATGFGCIGACPLVVGPANTLGQHSSTVHPVTTWGIRALWNSILVQRPSLPHVGS